MSVRVTDDRASDGNYIEGTAMLGTKSAAGVARGGSNFRRRGLTTHSQFYGLAIAAVALALLLKLVLRPTIGPETPFLLFSIFSIAVVVGDRWGGLGPGPLALALSAGVALYFFLPPYQSPSLTHPWHLTQVAVFLVEGMLISWVIATHVRVKEDLQEAKEAIEVANRSKDRFLAMLSHELRTPLTPVLMSATALRDDPATPAAIRRDLEMIRYNVERERSDFIGLMQHLRGST